MQKISHLFGHKPLLSPLGELEVDPDAHWISNETVSATVKWDGQPYLVHNGSLYRGHTQSKRGELENWLPWDMLEIEGMLCSTRTLDGWVPVNPKRTQDKPAAEAWMRLALELGILEAHSNKDDLFLTPAIDALAEKVSNGSYELVGPGIMGNRHGFDEPTLVRHGYGAVDIVLKDLKPLQMLTACHKALIAVYCSGIVFHRELSNVPETPEPNERYFQVTREDLGLLWPDPAMVEAMEQQAKAMEAEKNRIKTGNRGMRLLGPTGKPL